MAKKNYKYRKSFTDNRGKRHDIYANTIAERDKKLAKAKEKWNGSTVIIDNEKLTLDQWFKEWTDEKELLNKVKGSTIAIYKAQYNLHIKPEIGYMRLQSITQADLQDFQKQLLRKGVSEKNTKYIMIIIKSIFKSAFKDGRIKSNPSQNLTIVNPKDKSRAIDTKHRALSDEELSLFMSEAKNNHYYEFMSLMLLTGMRQGEVAALTEADIDEENGFIKITKTVTKNSKNELIIGDTPKSETSKREIPLTDDALEIIKSQKAKNKIVAIDKQNLLFTTVTGKMISCKAITRAISDTRKQVLKKTGIDIPEFSSHAFRDTFATKFAKETEDLQTLKNILGHKNLSMTSDLYAHVLPTTKKTKMEKVKFECFNVG